MSATDAFLDTNVLLYLLSSDPAKADRAEALISAGGVVSVQVLNEFASVAARQLAMHLPDIREVLRALRAVCSVEPLSLQTHDLALDLVERFHLSFYDGLIVAAALLAECGILYSEDMQDGQTIESVTIQNPFVSGPSRQASPKSK
jgi:predicted nucleic acid-binding protein